MDLSQEAICNKNGQKVRKPCELHQIASVNIYIYYFDGTAGGLAARMFPTAWHFSPEWAYLNRSSCVTNDLPQRWHVQHLLWLTSGKRKHCSFEVKHSVCGLKMGDCSNYKVARVASETGTANFRNQQVLQHFTQTYVYIYICYVHISSASYHDSVRIT